MYIVVALLISIMSMSLPVNSDTGTPPRCDCNNIIGICDAEAQLIELGKKENTSVLKIDYRVDVRTNTTHCALVGFDVDHMSSMVTNSIPSLIALTDGSQSEHYNTGPIALGTKLTVSNVSCRICFDANYYKEKQGPASANKSENPGATFCDMEYVDPDGNPGHYTGECLHGHPHGQGKFVHKLGHTYVGGWNQGLWEGYGEMKMAGTPDKSQVYGIACKNNYRNGKSQGQGSCLFSDGGHYTGEFKDDEVNGYGTYTYPNGDRYTGSFRDAERHGHGTYYYKSTGKTYTGEWKNNVHD